MRKSSISGNSLIKDYIFIVRESNDFNGWVNHSHPRYGKDGFFEAAPDTVHEAIKLQGLALTGWLESQWKWMSKEDVDLEPILRA